MNAFQRLRAVRRCLGGNRPFVPEPFRRQTEAWAGARLLVRFFYAGLAYLAASLLPGWDGFLTRVPVAPLWPVAWLHDAAGVEAVLLLYVFGAVAALAFPERLWGRGLAFVGVLEYVAYANSFGKIGHSLHAWVLVALIFLFVPGEAFRRGASRAARQRLLHVVWLGTFLLLYVYFMAGLSKVGGCLWQAWNGETTILNPHSLSNQVADRLNQTGATNPVAVWLIGHHWVGWALYLGVVYLQIAALWAAFRPVLIRPVGLAMVLFHVFTWFVFTIAFLPMVLLAGLLLLGCPWAGPTDLKRCWRALPGAFLFRRLFGRLT
ncbi:MAG TPA: hypothetical protein VIM58_01680 [Candidatus Methylacidiphilales bacterium]